MNWRLATFSLFIALCLSQKTVRAEQRSLATDDDAGLYTIDDKKDPDASTSDDPNVSKKTADTDEVGLTSGSPIDLGPLSNEKSE